MSLSPSSRRWLALGAVVLVLGGLYAGARFWLGEYVVRSVLRMGGASEIGLESVRARPWHVEVDGLRFRFHGQPFAARRVTLVREKWWRATLGDVRVEGAELPVTLDSSDVDPWNWATYEGGLDDDQTVTLPFRNLDLDGIIVVRMAALPDRNLAVKLEGRPQGGLGWSGSLQVEGEGFRLQGTGALVRAGQELEFHVSESELDLGVWAAQIQRLVVLPGAPWQLAGKLSAVGEGRVTARRFAATAQVKLREGRMRVATRDIAAEGVEADLEFSDLWKYRTEQAELRMAEFRVGRLPVRKVRADFGLWGAKTLMVDSARGEALGGRLTLAPLRYYLDQREVEVTLRPERIDAAQLLALAEQVPAAMTGALDGSLVLRIHGTGVRVNTGFLELAPSVAGALRFEPAALVRSGTKLAPETLKPLREAGNEPLTLSLRGLRLDIRPPGLPMGSSARLNVAGTTAADAPVEFELLVGRAVERYLQVMP